MVSQFSVWGLASPSSAAMPSSSISMAVTRVFSGISKFAIGEPSVAICCMSYLSWKSVAAAAAMMPPCEWPTISTGSSGWMPACFMVSSRKRRLSAVPRCRSSALISSKLVYQSIGES